MAYKNLFAQSISGKADLFCRLRDFLCARNGTYDHTSDGLGYTLWDSSYATDEDNPTTGDYFVIYSPGEDGNQDIFIQFTWYDATYFRVRAYLSWNPTTHAGTTSYATSDANNIYALDTMGTYSFYIFGDLDAFACFFNYGTGDYRGNAFGKLAPLTIGTQEDVAILSSGVSAGSSVAITLDAVPSNWEVGRTIFIRTVHTNNISTSFIEAVTISAISGNVVTVSTLAHAYAAGSKMQEFYAILCPNSYQFLAGGTFVFGIGSAESITSTYLNLTSGSYDPATYESRYLLSDFIVYANTGGWPIGAFNFVKWFNASTFLGSTVELDSLVDQQDNSWLLVKLYSGRICAFKEA